MKDANVHETSWILRILFLTIAPVKYSLEMILTCISSNLLFAGKPVEGSNFATYGQPKHLSVERAKYLVAVFESCAAYARNLLKYISDKESGLQADLPPIKNLFKTNTKD